MRRWTSSVPVLLVAASLCVNVSAAEKVKWEKHGYKKGVTVYTMPVKDSLIPRVKAVTKIEATTDAVWDHIIDPETHEKGFAAFKELGPCGKNCTYIYQRITHPLMKDRHYVIKMRNKIIEKDGLRTYRRWWRKTDEKPVEKADAIVADSISGAWILQPLDGGRSTRLTMLNHMDLGGKISKKLFAMGFVKSHYKILYEHLTAF